MASKTAEQVEAPEAAPEVSQDGPLLDMSDAAVKKMIKAAKTRGFVTYDELNKVLPSEEFSSEQIEDTLSMLSEMGINVVENDEADENQEGAAERDSDDDDDEAEPTGKAVATTTTTSSALDRTDDPVRMYLREMGSVELLSREGEIAIAKRIEAGRETMIAGLCESPLTFQAIIIWRDELNEGKILLRDIIDLDATFAGPDAKKVDHSQAALAGEAPPRVEPEEEEVDEDGDDDNSMSLAAMEAELKPKVLETFDTIAGDYKKLRKLQDQKVELALKGEELAAAQEKKYQKLTSDLIEEVKSLSLNNNRIESLVEQLYAINKRLMGLEGRLLRLAESHGVPRDEFLKQYFGNELDPNWIRRVSRLKGKGWVSFTKDERDQVKDLRNEIQTLAAETGLDIQEYRRIVATVQKGEREARIAKKEMVEANL
ncbi:MAG: RNA polymerase sigma factor region1.1 domain-containing protein, partial [Parvibaculum sp.]